MQKLILVGNLGRDAEVRQAGEQSVLSFSVACTERWKDNKGEKHERVEWFDCSYFTKGAENMAKYAVKGQTVSVTGKLRTREYKDKDGVDRKVKDVVVDEFEFVGGSRKNDEEKASSNSRGSNGGGRGSSSKGSSGKSAPAEQPPQGGDDDIPF